MTLTMGWLAGEGVPCEADTLTRKQNVRAVLQGRKQLQAPAGWLVSVAENRPGAGSPQMEKGWKIIVGRERHSTGKGKEVSSEACLRDSD